MIYIAGPLFNEMERLRNEKIDSILRDNGFTTYLPQRDGGNFANELSMGEDPENIRKRIFSRDVNSVKGCNILLFLFDGRVPDEGACFELGMAYAINKKCIGYKTDSRTFVSGYDNLMLSESLESVFDNITSLVEYLNKYKDEI